MIQIELRNKFFYFKTNCLIDKRKYILTRTSGIEISAVMICDPYNFKKMNMRLFNQIKFQILFPERPLFLKYS